MQICTTNLKQDFEMPDTVTKLAIDTIKIDTVFQQRKYLYMPAKVVGNSVSQPNNYLQVAPRLAAR